VDYITSTTGDKMTPLAKQLEANKKAERLRLENPDKAVYVIYDYETQEFDAATQHDLDYLQEIDHDFTIIYAV
jgi:hypothetical protein